MFIGEKTGNKTWECLRIELDSIDTANIIAFTEHRILEEGVSQKVIPPDDFLREDLEHRRENDIDTEVRLAIDRIVDRRTITEIALERFRERYSIEEAGEWIQAGYDHNRHSSWSSILHARISRIGVDLRAELEDAVREEIVSLLTEEE